MGVFNKTRDYEEKWPQNGDVFFWVRSDTGDICQSEWNEENQYHQFRRATGNMFRTRSAAAQGIERCMSHHRWAGEVR